MRGSRVAEEPRHRRRDGRARGHRCRGRRGRRFGSSSRRSRRDGLRHRGRRHSASDLVRRSPTARRRTATSSIETGDTRDLERSPAAHAAAQRGRRATTWPARATARARRTRPPSERPRRRLHDERHLRVRLRRARRLHEGTITVTGAADRDGRPRPRRDGDRHGDAPRRARSRATRAQTRRRRPAAAADAVKPTLRTHRRLGQGARREGELPAVGERDGDDPRQARQQDRQDGHEAARRRRARVSVRSAKLKKGRYKIEVRARDASGNVSTLASKSVRIRR